MSASEDSRWQFGKKEAVIQLRLPSISELITTAPTEYSTPAPPPSTQPNTSFPSSRSDGSQAFGEVVGHLPLQEPHSKLWYTARKGPVPLSGKIPRLSVTTQLNPPSMSGTKSHAQTLAPAPAMEMGESYTSEAFPQAQMPSNTTSPRRDALYDFSASGKGKHTNEMNGTTVESTFGTTADSRPCSYEDSLSRLQHYGWTLLKLAEFYDKTNHDQFNPHASPQRLSTKEEVTHTTTKRRARRGSMRPPNRNTQAADALRSKHTSIMEQSAPMLGDDPATCYNVSESNARRMRGTFAQRCNSCNCANTPEWRRGPHGDRTLCNACGLRYARLSRKRQLKRKTFALKPRVVESSSTSNLCLIKPKT